MPTIIQRNWLSENTISRNRKKTKTIGAVDVLLSEKCDNENLSISYFLNLLNVLGENCAHFCKVKIVQKGILQIVGDTRNVYILKY